ncbi:AraC family transcriptional regulator [Enemella sp. A6]|uniref:AraC family transcriptional regulator n=1 Tax=Enemella sp. A6 TaxID=3440152 RepID=UPI003EBA18F0
MQQLSGDDPSFLPSFPLFSGDDPLAMRMAIGDVTGNKHRMLTVSEKVQGEVNGVRLGRVGLVSIRYSVPLQVHSTPTGRRVLVVLPRSAMTVENGDHRWRTSAPFVMGTEHGTRLLPAPGFGALVAAVDAEAIEESVRRVTGRPLTDRLRITSEFGPLLLAAPELVKSAFDQACKEIELGVRGEHLSSLLGSHLLSSLAVGVSPFLRGSLGKEHDAGRGYLFTAQEYIDAHLAGSLTVKDIARACGISERQLHTAFNDFMSMTPARYVKSRRLSVAHRLLTDPERAPHLTVASVAKAIGVTHHGRFAKNYAERYGESPSESLATARAAFTQMQKRRAQ